MVGTRVAGASVTALKMFIASLLIVGVCIVWYERPKVCPVPTCCQFKHTHIHIKHRYANKYTQKEKGMKTKTGRDHLWLQQQ